MAEVGQINKKRIIIKMACRKDCNSCVPSLLTTPGIHEKQKSDRFGVEFVIGKCNLGERNQ